jgi:site-specific DNA recombinase
MSKGIALYARVSSNRQARDSTIESQIAAIRDFAAANQFTVDEDLVFVDDGVSGAQLERPALDLLRDRASAGHVDKVIALCPDRLARKYVHQLLLVEELSKLGTEVLFVNRNISATPEDQLLLQIQGVISEYEREKIAERSRRGKIHKAKQGKVSILTQAPYGFVFVRDGAESRYDVHPEEAQVVRHVFDMFCRQSKSIRAIQKTLRSDNVETREHHTWWGVSAIWRMLKNPAYVGRAAFRKTMLVPRQRISKNTRASGGHSKSGGMVNAARPEQDWITIPVPAIVDEHTFAMARDRLAENKRLSPRNNRRHDYLAGGLMHCKECGYSVHGEFHHGLGYYRCAGLDAHRRPQGRVCTGHPVRVEIIDDLVWDSTKRLVQEPRVVLDEYTRRLGAQEGEAASLEAIANEKDKEMRRLEHEKQRLLDLYQAGSIPLKDIETRLAKIRTRIKNAEDERNMARADIDKRQGQLRLIESFETFQTKVATRLDKLSFAEKKELVRLLITDVEVDTKKDKILIRHIIPADKVYRLRSGSQVR